jgi:riboflavin synthase
MFTGIITHKGSIQQINNTDSVYFKIKTDLSFLSTIKVSDSIAVNGVCLTVIEIDNDCFSFQLMPETMNVTCFQDSKVGDEVNLEQALQIGQRLDGHIVQGHVDGVGIVTSYVQNKDNWILGVEVPEKIRKYIAYKGSICISGVSLTISKKTEKGLEVSLIQYTLDWTNLKALQIGSKVNIEIDVIARYVENMIPSIGSKNHYLD